MPRAQRSSHKASRPPEPPTPVAAARPEGARPDDVPERPALAPNVQLAGRMDSGFAEPQWLVQRDGQFIQLPELFYHVAAAADGSRTLPELADAVSTATGRHLTADLVRLVVAAKLMPKGIVAAVAPAGGTAGLPSNGVKGLPSRAHTARPPLGMRLRTRMISPRFIDPITRVLQILFWPPVLVVVLVVIALAHVWLYLIHGVGGNVADLLATLRLLPLVMPLNILAAAFHELGHAAALRYGGGQVRGIGAGLYLIYPVFFTDVTDNYRLGRWARVRTDLGGFYFTLIFALGMIGLYLLTGHQLFLLVVLLLNFEILSQSLPYVRFDGYWVLADLTGIPDFFSQMGAFVRAMLPLPRWKGYRLPKLKGWVQAIFGLYIVVTVPLLAYLLFRLVQSLPQIVAITWSALATELPGLVAALRTGDLPGLAARALQVVVLALPTGGMLLIVGNVGRTAIKALWQWSRPLPARGVVRLVGTAAIAGFVTFLWLPRDAISMVPLLTRLPHSFMAWREMVWARMHAFAGIHRLGELGTLIVVTSLGLVALELCFVLSDLVSPAWTWLRRRRQVKGLASSDRIIHQQDFAELSRIAVDLAQAGTPDREIRDLLLAAGLDRKSVTLMLATLHAGHAAAQQNAARQIMASGAIVGVLGLLVTVGAWWAGANAGTLIVAGSVSLVAGVRLLRGLIRRRRGRARGAGGAGRRELRPLRPRLAAWSAAGLVLLAGFGLWGRLGTAPGAGWSRQAPVTALAAAQTSPWTPAATPEPPAGSGSAPLQDLPERHAAPTAPSPTLPATRDAAPALARSEGPAPTGMAPTTALPEPTPASPAPAATAPAAPSSAPSPPSAPAPAQPDGVVLAPQVNLRAGPGAAYPVLRQLPAQESLHILGQVAHLNWLQVSLADGQQGWVSGDPALVQVNRERASIPAASFRPLTGIVQQHGELHGAGELQLASGAARDALVVVMRDGAPVVAAYVRAGERYTLRGIPDGAYTVVTSQGDSWDGRGWTGDEQRNRVEQAVRFVTTDDAYSVWTINLVDAPTN